MDMIVLGAGTGIGGGGTDMLGKIGVGGIGGGTTDMGIGADTCARPTEFDDTDSADCGSGGGGGGGGGGGCCGCGCTPGVGAGKFGLCDTTIEQLLDCIIDDGLGEVMLA